MESPVAGAALAPLAAAVAYSRVHNGVHWPSDVFAGSRSAVLSLPARVVGGRCGTKNPPNSDPSAWFPRSRAEKACCLHQSWFRLRGRRDRESIRELLPEAIVYEFDADIDFDMQIDAKIPELSPKALGVCGGDGTVVTVATAATKHELPLAVFPGGTLNHFARDVGAVNVEETAQAVESGQAAFVDHAVVRTDSGVTARFLNTASLGGYPDAVRLREKWEPRFGKWPAAGAAMIRVLAAAEPMTVTIDGSGPQSGCCSSETGGTPPPIRCRCRVRR